MSCRVGSTCLTMPCWNQFFQKAISMQWQVQFTNHYTCTQTHARTHTQTMDLDSCNRLTALVLVCTHHQLTVGKPIGWDAAANPGFRAALLNYLCTLHSHSPAFGGAHFSRDYLVIKSTTMPWKVQERKVTQHRLNTRAKAVWVLTSLIFSISRLLTRGSKP